MRVLINCEFSGIIREEFRKIGYEAWSCDLRPTEIPSLYHIQGDALAAMQWGTPDENEPWDLMISHPPCTYLTNAGVRWLYKGGKKNANGEIDPERWFKMECAARFFNCMLKSDIQYVCVENPIMHPYAIERVESKYSQIVQPNMFGHAETKATCLWLKNLPLLTPTEQLEPDYQRWPPGKGNGYEPKVHHEPPSKGDEREMNRSRTVVGLAKAMASQWGRLQISQLQ